MFHNFTEGTYAAIMMTFFLSANTNPSAKKSAEGYFYVLLDFTIGESNWVIVILDLSQHFVDQLVPDLGISPYGKRY